MPAFAALQAPLTFPPPPLCRPPPCRYRKHGDDPQSLGPDFQISKAILILKVAGAILSSPHDRKLEGDLRLPCAPLDIMGFLPIP
jgi:hypothetical protein